MVLARPFRNNNALHEGVVVLPSRSMSRRPALRWCLERAPVLPRARDADKPSYSARPSFCTRLSFCVFPALSAGGSGSFRPRQQ